MNAGRLKPVIHKNEPSSPKFNNRSQEASLGGKIAERVKNGQFSLELL